MAWKFLRRCMAAGLILTLVLTSEPVAYAASEHRGQVRFGNSPVPGAVVTASQGDKRIIAVTDPQGLYTFADLPDGAWVIQVEMLGFSLLKQDVTVASTSPDLLWDLKMLPINEMNAATAPVPAPAPLPSSSRPAQPPPQAPFQRAAVNASASADPAAPPNGGDAPASSAFANVSADDLSQRAADGLLINGSVNNGAATPFAQLAAFGNNRRGGRPLYTGNFGFNLDSSALDARTFSLTGQDTPKPSANHLQFSGSVGGPIKIPHLVRNGPNFFVAYQRTQNRNAVTQSGLMPTQAQRNGDFSGTPTPIIDPVTGTPFAGNVIPGNRISPQATALLNLYPLPNFESSTRFNYQIPVVGATHQDALQTRLNRSIGSRDQLSGSMDYQNTRTDNSNLFGFLDQTAAYNMNVVANWSHRFNLRLSSTFRYQFIRSVNRLTPFFANRRNVSADAGISGNNQEPLNWGPPNLSFLNGTSGLSDSQQSLNRNQSSGATYTGNWSHGRHNFGFGGDFRRQQFNVLSQQDARGTFTFTGAATQSGAGTGSDLADFLLGIPDSGSLAFGNADKYFRQSFWDGFLTDDWRLGTAITLQLGARWEYESPITESYGRLVNLDIAPGFGVQAPVLASNPTGSVTGRKYSDSLMRPDKAGLEPRLGFAWRPLAGSSVVVRGGYGIYRNTSVYQSIATQMAQQSPLSKSLSVQNTASNPLTLANGFIGSPVTTRNTFAVDPDFRVGYAQNWQLSIQRDLPAALQMTATYLGTKGTRLMQEILPNTFPSGAVNPCPSCLSGYAYLTSNGNSNRHAGQFQLRRRLRSGFTATAQYTFAKAIDNAGFTGTNSLVAQNWLDLNAERGLSSFDQRHQLTLQTQLTTGTGLGGGALLSGWKGKVLGAWTLTSQLTLGSGSPLTPIIAGVVTGTGVSGSIRPDATGASVYAAPEGLFLNPAAYRAPAPGTWGNAGRNSITGPSQFGLNASLNRAFQMTERFGLDLGINATNVLNHATFPTWNTTITSAQFGLPNRTNPMRSIQTSLRVRF